MNIVNLYKNVKKLNGLQKETGKPQIGKAIVPNY